MAFSLLNSLKSFQLDSMFLRVTIVSGEDLDNVNWRYGDLKPYIIAYVDSEDSIISTEPDDSGSTCPSWNVCTCFPLRIKPDDDISNLFLTLEVRHLDACLVGIAHVSFKDLIEDFLPSEPRSKTRDLYVYRPGNPEPKGKIQIKTRVFKGIFLSMLIKETIFSVPIPLCFPSWGKESVSEQFEEEAAAAAAAAGAEGTREAAGSASVQGTSLRKRRPILSGDDY